MQKLKKILDVMEAQNILITWVQKRHTKLPLRLSRKAGLNERERMQILR